MHTHKFLVFSRLNFLPLQLKKRPLQYLLVNGNLGMAHCPNLSDVLSLMSERSWGISVTLEDLSDLHVSASTQRHASTNKPHSTDFSGGYVYPLLIALIYLIIYISSLQSRVGLRKPCAASEYKTRADFSRDSRTSAGGDFCPRVEEDSGRCGCPCIHQAQCPRQWEACSTSRAHEQACTRSREAARWAPIHVRPRSHRCCS
jgi:hypothetical protein